MAAPLEVEVPINDDVKHEFKLDKYGFDCTVLLTMTEKKAIEEIFNGAPVTETWAKYFAKSSNAQSPKYYKQNASFWKNSPNIALYLQYMKASVAASIQLNSDVISKKIAVQLNTSMNDFIHSNGTRKNLSEISPLALAGAKVRMKFNAEGEPNGPTEVELPTVIDVLNALAKLGEIDKDLVQSLKAKVNKQNIKLKRNY